MRAIAVSLLCAACGSSPKGTPPPPVQPSPELSPALSPLAWWLGDWKGASGSEHWVAAAGAIYGVALNGGDAFEVMIVDDAEGGGPADGKLRLWAMPGGTRQVEFAHSDHTTESATFANPTHDDPKTITYGRTATGLRATLTGARTLTFDFSWMPPTRAAELEAADLAFSEATKARGIAGWVDAFDPAGWMWRKTGRVERAAIADFMGPVLSAGSLVWAPIASAKAGGLGFTVGKATFTGDTPDDGWRSTYVTIWKQQPGGGWKVLFDTGRGVNEP